MLSVGLNAAPHGPQDSLEPAIQGEEVRLCEHRRELVFQQRLPHYVAESVVGLGQQLQVRECFPFYSGRTKSGDQVSKRKERNFSNLLPSPPTVVGADVWRAFAPSVFSGTLNANPVRREWTKGDSYRTWRSLAQSSRQASAAPRGVRTEVLCNNDFSRKLKANERSFQQVK